VVEHHWVFTASVLLFHVAERSRRPGTSAMDKPDTIMAPQVAPEAGFFSEWKTGHAPAGVTVVLGADTRIDVFGTSNLELVRRRLSRIARGPAECTTAANVAHGVIMRYAGTELSRAGVALIAHRVIAERSGRVIWLDLSEATEPSLAALAELVLLRRSLLHRGGDLMLLGLHGRVRGLWEIARLEGILPIPRPEEERCLLTAAGLGGTCYDLGEPSWQRKLPVLDAGIPGRLEVHDLAAQVLLSGQT